MHINNSQSAFLRAKLFILNIIHRILDFQNFPTKKDTNSKPFLQKIQQI